MSKETDLLFGSSVFTITNTICDGVMNKSSIRTEDICAWNTQTGARRSTLLRDGIYAIEAYVSAKAGKVDQCNVLETNVFLHGVSAEEGCCVKICDLIHVIIDLKRRSDLNMAMTHAKPICILRMYR